MQGHELYLFSRIYLLDNLTAMPTLKSTGIATQLTLLILIRQASLGMLAGMLKTACTAFKTAIGISEPILQYWLLSTKPGK